MWRGAVLALAAGATAALASSPGQPLDCSDMVFFVPGLTCRVFRDFGIPGDDLFYASGADLAVDNEGYQYVAKTVDQNTVQIARSKDGGATEEVVAELRKRRVTTCLFDCARVPGNPDIWNADYMVGHLQFDPINGRLTVPLVSFCCGACKCPDDYGGGRWIAAIEGFATLFEIMQTYTPSPPAFGFTVPYMPEGLERADSFDTYYGSLTKPLDLSRAQPLQCAYGAGSNVGDRLTFPDTAPDPAPGEAVYFLTAVTFGTERRIGRSATGGRLAGRDPSALPPCPVSSVEP